jgi:hypothetical protein
MAVLDPDPAMISRIAADLRCHPSTDRRRSATRRRAPRKHASAEVLDHFQIGA